LEALRAESNRTIQLPAAQFHTFQPHMMPPMQMGLPLMPMPPHHVMMPEIMQIQQQVSKFPEYWRHSLHALPPTFPALPVMLAFLCLLIA
jgi:hypothetical protein